MKSVPAVAGVGIPPVRLSRAVHASPAARHSRGVFRRSRRRGETVLVAVIAHWPDVQRRGTVVF